MDTELGALPTLPVRARTVSGCVNSAFLDISQHFTGHLFRPWIPNSTRCQHFVSALGPFLADCIRWPMIRNCRRGPARTTQRNATGGLVITSILAECRIAAGTTLMPPLLPRAG